MTLRTTASVTHPRLRVSLHSNGDDETDSITARAKASWPAGEDKDTLRHQDARNSSRFQEFRQPWFRKSAGNDGALTGRISPSAALPFQAFSSIT